MRAVKRGKKIFEIVIEELLVMIESDNLQVGDKLPTEKELMEMLEVSRSSLREALTVLQNKGILEIIQGKGIFLKQKLAPQPAGSSEAVLNYLQEARLILECQLAYMAAERATEEDLMLIEEALVRMEDEQSKLNLKRRVEADYDFHYRVAAAAKNPILLDMLKQIDDRLYPGRKVTLTFTRGWEKATTAHRKIYQAILQKDAEQAKEEMKKHIQEISKAQKHILALKQKEGESEA